MTKKMERWEYLFNKFKRALIQLNRFIDKGDSLTDLEKQGMIKAFEYTFEQAWKTMKHYYELQGTVVIQGSRDAFLYASQFQMIEGDEGWLDMLRDRNDTVHSYDEILVSEIADSIRNVHFPLFVQLRQNLELIHLNSHKTAKISEI
ncbi:HI0074 family nucleotidyltransferase substrate-binding subunit [Chitinophaga pollutisoli]|uniref:HI0074 family nucleotidyltransferase substrate-binding subunit n=1 Tax=Chitinophaga pollutisoli TaxID=3133966 RepID=A0ABZ2YKF6_9BACT